MVGIRRIYIWSGRTKYVCSSPNYAFNKDKLSEIHIIDVNNVREMDFHLALTKNT